MDITEDEIDDTVGIGDVESKNTFKDIKEVTLNYEELKKIYKNKIRKVTKFELPTIIGYRGTQIANGAPVLVDVPDYMTDTMDIAEYEFKKGATPFIIKKRVGNSFEYWKLEDLSHNLTL
jgi:DNA-directed RNA polymerase subunit K